ncbi:MAG: T9SS type A sorting domain-containing protein [Bacteroidia bacterium]|nr:T9SS type A sorting domain-containing protein [Bacteroidia bacterium]MCF8427691.1 T9SS type A sorting domain-containing protein [Bacteroidia bacterium]MCF8447371.1 T9SS type A sorting domain-containing protein [Bacteroidia bacterium]
MDQIKKIKKTLALCSLLLLIGSKLIAQMPNPALVGYWHNWNDANAPYIQLDSIDNRYNVIEIAFAIPTTSTNMTMLFTPDIVSQSTFISKVQALQTQGKKVLISIGGATTSIDLTTTLNKNAFISSMTSIINTYGFDGIDIDIENGNSILITGGTIAAPSNIAQLNLIDAIKQIMANYRSTHPQKLLLTLTPETAYVQGGQSGFGSIWGGYLPIINALRDSLDILQVQLYNSGSMYGIDSKIYTQGTADFIIAMTEAVIQGFSTSGGTFVGLPASKVAVGLPACSSAAGGGFVDSATIKSAINYLTGKGPKPGTYVLSQSGGYPTLRGMMTWSINWDAVSTCANRYQFANNYQGIFGSNITAIVPNYVSTNGLVAWWPFTGNSKDSSGYGFNGIVSGATLTIDRFGKANKAYSFNGVSSKITGPTNALLNLAHNRTISVWMKSTDSISDAGIIGYLSNGHNGYQILLKSSGKIASMEDNWTGGANNPPTNGWDFANSTNSSYLNDNIWHNVVSVRANDTTRIYIDGVLQNTSYTALIPNFNSSSITIGSSNGSSQFFKGSIDEIGIWNRALSPLELSNLNYGCPYSITSQPANQTASIGDSKNFTLVHSGSTINYQWQTNPIGCGWQNLSNINQYAGVQTNVLSVSGLSYPNHNQVFRIVSTYGECADTSNIVKLILTNIANDSLRIIQLKNDSILKSETITFLISDTTDKGKTIADLIADTTNKANTISLLINDTTNKAKTISFLINDTTNKANTISLLINDITDKANTISLLINDTTDKANTISFLINDTTNKGKTIADLISDNIINANTINFLISDTTSKGETIRLLETALANKHDTIYVASTISNDTLKISIHTGISPLSPMLNSLKVYPNPASTYLIIDLENPGYFIAKLTGISGQTTITQNSTTIDISSLANGIYILTIFDSENKLLSTNKVAIIK